MNACEICEIVLFIWLTLLTIVVLFILLMLDRTDKLNDTTQSRTGHWIFKDEDDQACLIYTCDRCGEQITILDDTMKSPQKGHYNFCPNCGAKMESESEKPKGE